MVALVVEASNQMVTSFLKLCWMDVTAAYLELPNMEVAFTMDFVLHTLLASSISILLLSTVERDPQISCTFIRALYGKEQKCSSLSIGISQYLCKLYEYFQ